MPLFRIRTEIEDRPGRLALLTAALAGRGANILSLSVQVGPEGVVDEFIVDAPAGDGPEAGRDLAEALGAAGGARTAVRPARPHDLVDEPTRALVLAARLASDPDAAPAVLAELLRADDSAWIGGVPPAAPADPCSLIVAAGGERAVRLRRWGLPFTATEEARAAALLRAAAPAERPRPGVHTAVLRDGTRVAVRPIDPGDADAVRALHERCSTDSRRLRYFSPKPYPPRRAFEKFCDPARGRVLVAEGPDGSVLALAHLIHVVDPGVAEIAFLVEDAWQGRGLGRVLATLLLDLARDRGLAELRATALSENVRTRRLLTSLGGRTRRTADPAILEIRLPVAARAPVPATLGGWRDERHL
ncbi:GNAT family N-acetyltransferase [Spirillospora albida]|uniref:GNAT family N-acetyltransferase n=1 Tax=Spirillospora albida TaxID=58123 RepID=UPI0004C16976|nr:GNAT family N-acetyltransferase [Spirillospora albida]